MIYARINSLSIGKPHAFFHCTHANIHLSLLSCAHTLQRIHNLTSYLELLHEKVINQWLLLSS